jgi:hypothetical protein
MRCWFQFGCQITSESDHRVYVQWNKVWRGLYGGRGLEGRKFYLDIWLHGLPKIMMNLLLGLDEIWTGSYTEQARHVTVEINFSVFRRVITGSCFFQFISLFASIDANNMAGNTFLLRLSLLYYIYVIRFLPRPFTTCAIPPWVEDLLIPIESPNSRFRQRNVEISCTEKHFSPHFIRHKEQLRWEVRRFPFLEIFMQN